MKRLHHNPEVNEGIFEPLYDGIDRLLRKSAEPLTSILRWAREEISNEDYAEIQRKFIPISEPKNTKFLAFAFFLPKKLRQLTEMGLAQSHSRMRVLSIGCGPCHELLLCRFFGHEAVGVDLPFPEPHVFTAMVDLFQVERLSYEVKARERLPEVLTNFNRVMMLSTVLDAEAGWDEDDWAFFLNDVRSRLEPGGVFYVTLTSDPRRSAKLWEFVRNEAFETRGHVLQFRK